MDDEHQLQRAYAEVGPRIERCAYCGAPLDQRYYFCLACATPYKHYETVLTPYRPRELSDGERIEQHAPHVSGLFWTYMAVVLGTGITTQLLFWESNPGLALVLRTIAMFITTCIFAARHWTSLRVQFATFGFNRPAALIGLVLLVPLLAINYGYHGWLMREFELDGTDMLDRLRQSGLGRTSIVFLFCVLPAILEEIAFRGLVQHWLQVAIRPLHAVGLAAFLFTVLHFSVLSFPYLFAVGMLLGWVKLRTRSLYPCMLIHFAHNLVAIEMFSS